MEGNVLQRDARSDKASLPKDFPSVSRLVSLTARHLPSDAKKDRLRQQFWQKAVICIPSFIQFSTHPASPCKTLPYSEYWPICASAFPKNPASPVKRYPSEKHPEAAHNSVMFNLKSPYISDNLGHISDNLGHIPVNRPHIQRKRSTYLTENEEYAKKEAHPATIPLTYLYVSRTAARWANKLVIMLYVFLSFSRSSFDN